MNPLAARLSGFLLVVFAAGLPLIIRPASIARHDIMAGALALIALMESGIRLRDIGSPLAWIVSTMQATLFTVCQFAATAPSSNGVPAAVGADGVPVAYLLVLLAAFAFDRRPGIILCSGAVMLAAWLACEWWVSNGSGDASSASLVGPGGHAGLVGSMTLCTLVLAVAAHRRHRLETGLAHAARERANLARFFSPNLLDDLAARDERGWPARCQQVGVLFADMEDFTHLAESMAPEQVLALLRDFHGRLEKQVFRHGGTLEKFIGDAMLATFGVPHPSALDAVRTLACARGMLEAVDRWNAERVARGEPGVRIGIGLHYGSVVLGEIGNDRNAAFVSVGDTINTASRLQSLTRELSCALVASEALLDAVRRTDIDAASILRGFSAARTLTIRGREHLLSACVLPHSARS
ncbi:MAG: adenylate/guanylate cyclase domain-containing protein [Gemmatimonadetes bacterium]|nr:adenylate/guanylate cyclase domain-containing protein [Gemmatimonadota bacterium]